jgi:hypothetical protein
MNQFAINSDIFERKIRKVILETPSLSAESKAHILLCIEEELRDENVDDEGVMIVGKEGMWETDL